jgi:hypothetical protein
VVSTFRTSPPIVADELRRQADFFIELQDLAPKIARRSREAAPPRKDDPGKDDPDEEGTEYDDPDTQLEPA